MDIFQNNFLRCLSFAGMLCAMFYDRKDAYAMNQFEKATAQSDEQFLRAVGVSKGTFDVIFNLVASHIQSVRDEQPMKKRGQKSQLPLVERLLLTFTYLRHYSTFVMLGDEFGISKSYANKIYHEMLNVLVKVLPMKSREHLLDGDLETIVIDVTEQPIERPTIRQCPYYSGQQKLHTIKVQIIVCLATLEILSVVCGRGKVHDYTTFSVMSSSRRNSAVKCGRCQVSGFMVEIKDTAKNFKHL